MRNGLLYCEVLNADYKISLQNSAITGQVSELNDRFCKSTILSLTNKGKIITPRVPKMSTENRLPFLVVQAFIPKGKPFVLEIDVTDHMAAKKKLTFIQCNEIAKTYNSAKIPSNPFIRDMWNNICIDIPAFLNECFRVKLDHIDKVTVHAFCRIRRIFSVKFPLKNTNQSMEKQLRHDILPTGVDMPESVPFICQYIHPQQINPKDEEIAEEEPSSKEETFMTDPNHGFRSPKLKSKYAVPETKLYDKINKAQLGPKLYRQYAIEKQLLYASSSQAIKNLEIELLSPSKSMPDFKGKKEIRKKIPILSESPNAIEKQLLYASSSQALKDLEIDLLSPSKSMPDFKANKEINKKIPILSESQSNSSWNNELKLKSPNFYESLIARLNEVRHETPPFVNSGPRTYVYDPMSHNYSPMRIS